MRPTVWSFARFGRSARECRWRSWSTGSSRNDARGHFRREVLAVVQSYGFVVDKDILAGHILALCLSKTITTATLETVLLRAPVPMPRPGPKLAPAYLRSLQ